MKKISILLLLFLLGCQQNKNSKQLIDLVPTDPLLIVKNTSFQEKNSIDFNVRLNEVLDTNIDSILHNHKDSKVLISYHKIGKDKIILTLSDDEGDVREICTKENDKETECKILDSFSTSYEYSSNAQIFEIWISRPNPNIDENKLATN